MIKADGLTVPGMCGYVGGLDGECLQTAVYVFQWKGDTELSGACETHGVYVDRDEVEWIKTWEGDS